MAISMNFTAQNVTPIGRTAKWAMSLVTSSHVIAFSAFYPWVLMCVLSCSAMSDSVTLWTLTHQAPLAVGFSRQEYWSGLPFPTLEALADPGTEPTPLASPASAGRYFTTVLLGKPSVLVTAVQRKTSPCVVI